MLGNGVLNPAGLPRVVKEQFIGTKGKWLIKGRIVLYHGGAERRAELMLEQDNLKANLADVGFSLEELAHLQKLLYKFAVESGEMA